MFENCYPNTLDTTVNFRMVDGKPDTFVITAISTSMWLRDSSRHRSGHICRSPRRIRTYGE
jgi:meiotically up-regulated gene 157 (Mug157) protein